MANPITRLLTSRFSKILLALVVLCAVGTQAVPYVVDTKPYVERIAATVKETTGAVLMVKSGSQFQLVPYPALILNSVEITEPDVPHSPSITADVAEIGIDPMSLLTGNPYANKVRVGGISVVAEKQKTSDAQWGFIGLDLLKKLASIKPDRSIDFETFGGRISVADAETGETQGLGRIQASGSIGENSRVNGSFDKNGTVMQFSASRDGVIGATPISFLVDNGAGSSISLKGSMDFTAAYPLITGKLEVSASDITQFTAVQKDIAPKDIKPSELPAAVPLKLTADYLQNETTRQLTNMSLDVLNSKASGTLDWGIGKGSHKLTLDFSTLDIVKARELFGMFASASNAKDTRGPKTLFDKDFDMALDVKAQQITNGTQNWNKAAFSGTISDGVLTVNQLTLALPGDSTLTLFGLLSVSDTQGLRFEGNTEAQGTSLRDLLTVFDESAINLPQLGFGAFKLRSNLFISKELMRLSEADAKFSELSLKGGLVAYFDKKPRLEAEIGLRDIDFDYFRNSWRTNAAGTNSKVFLRFDKDMNFDWLKKLAASIDFKVDVQGFNFLERKGRNASFRLFAQTGEIGVYNAKFNYDQDITEANLKLDVNGAQPALSLVLNTSELNTNYFMLNPVTAKPIATPVKLTDKSAEDLPDMPMPDSASAEELRQKIAEEAATMQAPSSAPISVADEPQAAVLPPAGEEVAPPPAVAPDPEIAEPVELKPLVDRPSENDDGTRTIITTTPQSLLISSAEAQEVPILALDKPSSRWTEEPIDMSLIEGINGNFDVSVGRLQHEHLLFQNFKMLSKLERNLLTFQTLTFLHWGGSLSINGTIFGGKVPGMSLGFILASVDVQQMLDSLLGIKTITGRTSISGTFDTSGVNSLSWVNQATAKTLFAGRGINIKGFDVASVLGAVSASRTAADVFNSVNMSLVGGSGEYSVDGAANLQGGVLSTPGIALRAGRIVGTVFGDFRLLPWDVNLTGTFKFPELSAENVPVLTVQWSGPVQSPAMQTDTQALEAFVSKRITGN